MGDFNGAIGVGKSGMLRIGAGSEGGANDGRLGILGRLYDGGGGRGTAFDPPRGLNFSRSAMTEFLSLLPELSAMRLGVFVLIGILVAPFAVFLVLMSKVGGTSGVLLFSWPASLPPISGLSVENIGAVADGGGTTSGGVVTFDTAMRG